MKKLLAAVLIALTVTASLVVGTTQTASAQSYDTYDWGWVQGYFGGVHIYLYDYCPYVSDDTQCRHFHYDHHHVVNNTITYDEDDLPEYVWPTSIDPGSYASDPLFITYSAVGGWSGSNLGWYPGDDPSTCPSGQSICGLNSNGMIIYNSGGYFVGGSTAHARVWQSNVDCSGCLPNKALTLLY